MSAFFVYRNQIVKIGQELTGYEGEPIAEVDEKFQFIPGTEKYFEIDAI